MKLRVVIDTNIWIRILLKGRITLPILEAFNQDKFQLVMSQSLLDELHKVWNRPRLNKYIDLNQAIRLEQQLKNRAIWIEPKTIPPHCRDPKDLPVLATAIDGKAKIIVSVDDDLRADEALREAMALYSIELLGVNSFLKYLEESEE
ncbi:MAG: putative toxin-antitoxin system toxin component, PIN family [Pseudanabaena sp. M135S2SP2A07QC]|jgi:putative PIN family toxin of toxin-antitoxin system|nr:putative toxin-antitoxin system toxin component, PIN family [Pseudanabaena sp. M179S2SP2A07QC]MCA6530993.1 putative toxin-antitoxin system toxin component, PIN family [Pseudanabaena sp. M125S2SP2A07QC]MCA6535589.1 putative toxin-antitoxin system toxin component, PIN family [Pseudanabaena sp. M176S2SP2A07QC]MCA6540793.1 putative toxin-antitoxin system toxin component, PIN family [Pseudanabaena sp. M037S2SP2A07QC]MCA6546451.1 putative toxin-antitoxin system toxin component, PIN family [Pseudan